MLGMNAQYNLNGSDQLLAGLYFRTGDAAIVMIGFQLKNIKLSFSYDITISTLKNYNGGRGAYEFSSIYTGYYDEYNGNRRQSMCPGF